MIRLPFAVTLRSGFLRSASNQRIVAQLRSLPNHLSAKQSLHTIGRVSASAASIHTTTINTPKMSAEASTSTAPAPATSGFYSLKAQLPGGKVYDFEQLRGKVVLIVNTASKWCVRVSVAPPIVLPSGS